MSKRQVIVVSSSSSSPPSSDLDDCIILGMSTPNLKRAVDEKENLEALLARSHLNSVKKIGVASSDSSSPPTPVRRHGKAGMRKRLRQEYLQRMEEGIVPVKKHPRGEHSELLNTHLEIYLDHGETDAALSLLTVPPLAEMRPRLEIIKRLFVRLWNADEALEQECLLAYLQTLPLPLGADNLWGWRWLEVPFSLESFSSVCAGIVELVRDHGDLAERKVTFILELGLIAMHRQTRKQESESLNPITHAMQSRLETRRLSNALFDILEVAQNSKLKSLWLQLIEHAGYLADSLEFVSLIYSAAKSVRPETLEFMFTTLPRSLFLADLAYSWQEQQPLQLALAFEISDENDEPSSRYLASLIHHV